MTKLQRDTINAFNNVARELAVLNDSLRVDVSLDLAILNQRLSAIEALLARPK